MRTGPTMVVRAERGDALGAGRTMAMATPYRSEKPGSVASPSMKFTRASAESGNERFDGFDRIDGVAICDLARVSTTSDDESSFDGRGSRNHVGTTMRAASRLARVCDAASQRGSKALVQQERRRARERARGLTHALRCSPESCFGCGRPLSGRLSPTSANARRFGLVI